MIDINLAKKAINLLKTNEESVKVTFDNLLGFISQYLVKQGVALNTRNASEVTSIMVANLYPHAPLSSMILNCVEAGTMPDYNNSDPELYSLHRAIACFMDGIISGRTNKDIVDRASKVLEHIEKSGYLPLSSEIEF